MRMESMTDQPRPRTGGPAALGDGAAHGIVLRLTDPARIRAARTNTERAAASAAARRTGSFWLQHAEIPSTARRADRMRQREVRRPLHDADPGLRTVLTCYPDGVADLVVVARRGVLDHAGLRALLHGLTAPDRDVSALVTALRERTARGAAGRPPHPPRPGVSSRTHSRRSRSPRSLWSPNIRRTRPSSPPRWPWPPRQWPCPGTSAAPPCASP